ncbi:MAG: hypothetical protein HUU20_06355 [Pirellulales bacterium]|nr:hypothetical protein [Pirellulales bacterium]
MRSVVMGTWLIALFLVAFGPQGTLPSVEAADSSAVGLQPPLQRSMQDVNTTDLRKAIVLGCRTMQNTFDADDNGVPFFGSTVFPGTPGFSFSGWHSEAHVPGRHLNALLNAEDAAGVEIDPAAVEKHRRAALLSYSGVVPLPLNRQSVGGPLVNFCPHNIREGFHALAALVQYRGDEKARELAEQSIQAVMRFWDPQKGWDVEQTRKLGLTYLECQGFIHGEGRMIGPLVKYYQATGHAPALELALRLKEKAVGEFYLEDGDYTKERFVTTHAHSITCVLSSLAQLADLLHDAALLDRVKRFYDHGLWKLRDEIGWSPESVFQQGTDHGEVNNSGDILETALILGRWGYPEYYHDAERMLRCHILPCQLRDVSFIQDAPNPEGRDSRRNVADRHLGAFGFPAPYGHQSVGRGRGAVSFNLDIVGGAVGSLDAAYREVTRFEKTGHWVNLLFDHRTESIEVKSPYTHDGLEVVLHKPGPLWVRIPPWVDRKEVRIEGADAQPQWHGAYLFLAQVPAEKPVAVRFPLKAQELTLSERVHVHPIRVQMRGDSVVAMENFGADLIYFPPYAGPTQNR